MGGGEVQDLGGRDEWGREGKYGESSKGRKGEGSKEGSKSSKG